MLYIKPNYNSWVMLPLIGNVTINTLLINNVFIGKDDDVKEDYLYILVNNHCDKDTQNYVSELKSAKSFVNFEFIDIDLMLFKFKIDIKHVDYNALINAKYNNISSSYCHNLAEYILDNLVKDKNLNVGNIVRELAKEINGGGGGQAFYAQAGGSKAEGLDNAINKAKTLI